MERLKYFEIIVTNLNILRYILFTKAKVNHYDFNKEAEYFFSELMNRVYGFKLIRLPRGFPGLDLSSKEDRIGVQVTAENTADKIDRTIKIFEDNEYYKDFDRLLFFIITKKSNHSKDFQTRNFRFDKENDIWDIDDICGFIEGNCKLDKMKEIADFILKEIPYHIKSNTSSSDIFHQKPDYESYEYRNLEKVIEYYNDYGNEAKEFYDSFKQSLDTVFEKLQSISKKERLGVFVSLVIGDPKGVIPIDTWFNFLVSSHDFEDHEARALCSRLIQIGLIYDDEDSDLRMLHLTPPEFWEDLKLLLVTKDERMDLVVNLNFTLLDK